jgi:hypothetical protein
VESLHLALFNCSKLQVVFNFYFFKSIGSRFSDLDLFLFLQGAVRITVSVPNVDEGNLKGQLLEITVQSLSETIGSLKEKIAGDIQLPANKQKLSGKPGFLKDNMSLAYYNIGAGETLNLSLRERGGRKR